MLAAHIADEPLSRAIAVARPALLLALLGGGMKTLVATPVWALKYSLPIIAAVQVAYAVVCLPVAGSSLAKARKGKKNANGNTVSVRVFFFFESSVIFSLLNTSSLTNPHEIDRHSVACAGCHFDTRRLRSFRPIRSTIPYRNISYIALCRALFTTGSFPRLLRPRS